MTTPLETMGWLSVQFRDRAKDDPEEHTETDAKEVEAAKSAFESVLSALKLAEKHIDHVCSETSEADLPDWFAGLKTIRDAIAAADGVGTVTIMGKTEALQHGTGLLGAISFLEGFEGDELQEGIPELIAATKKADELLHRNLDQWEDEEESVQEEHHELISDLRKYLGRG